MSANVWYDKEERFLRRLQTVCQQLSKQYMELYKITHGKQSRLRLPSIILSSFSGVASFGTSSFPPSGQKYVSICVGIVNITIAMLQTYESYLKIADIVAKSLTASASLKRLADEINCELYIPIENRSSSGNTFLRDSFQRYQSIIADAPPLAVDEEEASLMLKKLMRESENILNDDDIEDVKTNSAPEADLKTVSLQSVSIQPVSPQPVSIQPVSPNGRIEFDLESVTRQQKTREH